MKLFRLLVAASFLAIGPAVAGCGSDDDVTVVEDGKPLSELEIASGIDTLAVGDSVRFKAVATYADGSTEDVTDHEDIVWNTSDAENATVDQDGNVTAVDEGPVTITATFKGKTAEESFLVTP
ncbi:MAG: Ig-like domain-containing protein [Polyangiaceae bacterium]|nr:Ig-like domain-containing protein [Polyangiaceae bacterium]